MSKCNHKHDEPVPVVEPVAVSATSAASNDNQLTGGNEHNQRRKRNAIEDIQEMYAADFDENVEEDDMRDNDNENDFQNFDKIYPSAKVCTMLDRAGLSNKLASYAFLTILTESGIGPEHIVCSASTMFNCRRRNRIQEANRIKETFRPNNFTTIHFDGKTYISKGQVLEKRLAIVLSKENEYKILGIERVDDGKSETIAKKVYETLLNWNSEHIFVACFDTEAVNSGRMNGVIVRLGRLLEKELIAFACRHHVYEVFLGIAFHISVERGLKSDSPKINIFEKFAEEYSRPNFDKLGYSTIQNDTYFKAMCTREEIEDIVAICRNVLPKLTNSRNEYSELARLVIILLSPKNECQFKINKPGAYTRARYMN